MQHNHNQRWSPQENTGPTRFSDLKGNNTRRVRFFQVHSRIGAKSIPLATFHVIYAITDSSVSGLWKIQQTIGEL